MAMQQSFLILLVLGICCLYYWHLCIVPWVFQFYFLLPRGKFYLLLAAITIARAGLLYLPLFILPIFGLDKSIAQNIALPAMLWVFVFRPLKFRYLFGYWPLFPDREANKSNFNNRYQEPTRFTKEFEMSSKGHRHLLVAWAITFDRLDLVEKIAQQRMWASTARLINLARTHDISKIEFEGGLWY